MRSKIFSKNIILKNKIMNEIIIKNIPIFQNFIGEKIKNILKLNIKI